jgi:hypothetical protein
MMDVGKKWLYSSCDRRLFVLHSSCSLLPATITMTGITFPNETIIRILLHLEVPNLVKLRTVRLLNTHASLLTVSIALGYIPMARYH